MKKVYFYSLGDDLEEGIFDEAGNCLYSWQTNDLSWTDYHIKLLHHLGYTVIIRNLPNYVIAKAEKYLQEGSEV